MGMSASQARLLTLTARLSDLEFQAQNISNAKIRLADSSADVSRKYQDALSAQKLTVKSRIDDMPYIDATANNLTTYGETSGAQRILTDSAGTIMVSQDVIDKYNRANGDLEAFLNAFNCTQNGKNDSANYAASMSTQLNNILENSDNIQNESIDKLNETLDMVRNILEQASKLYTGDKLDKLIADAEKQMETIKSAWEKDMNAMGKSIAFVGLFIVLNDKNVKNAIDSATYSSKYDSSQEKINYYTNIFNEMSKGYKPIDNNNANDSEWLYKQLESGNIFIEQWKIGVEKDGSDGFEQISWTSGDSSLLTRSDNSQTAKAEAEYETAMAAIQAKDKRFDLNLKQLDTEHNAIQTEMESVKKVLDKNIEKSFKIFEA